MIDKLKEAYEELAKEQWGKGCPWQCDCYAGRFFRAAFEAMPDLFDELKAQEREHVRVENVRRLIKELRADVRDDWGIQNEIADKIEKAID